MLAAPSGTTGFIDRHRTAVLTGVAAVTGMVTAIAAALSWLQTIVWADVAALAAGAVLAALVAWWQTRHVGLAFLVAATPLPGLIWAAPLSAGSGFAMVPVAAYGFGVALAMLMAQHVLDRTLAVAGEPPLRATVTVLGLTVALAVIWFRRTVFADAALQMTVDFLAVSLSVLLLLPISASQFHVDEAYVAQANRSRERRDRAFAFVGNAAIPRWGLSLSGIALIFAALGWFGGGAPAAADWWRAILSTVLVGSVFGWVAGGWREGVCLALLTVIACLLLLWWRSYDARLPFGAVNALEAAMLAGFSALAGARRFRIWLATGDASEIARRRVLEGSSGAVFAALGAAAAALPWLVHPGAGAIVLAIAATGLVGALLFPILLTGVEALVPRQRSVEDVFHGGR